MNPALAFAALLAVTLAWFLLPLLPALRELLRPSDLAPLNVVGRDAADVGLFARGFRSYLTRQLGRLATDTPAEVVGSLPDRTPFVRGRRLPDELRAEAVAPTGLDRVVILSGPTVLPGGETFLRELYAQGPFAGGPGGTYRALLGDAGITLGPESTVLRWAHARGELLVGDRTNLGARASSEQGLRLGAGVEFARLLAPRIEVTGGADLPVVTDVSRTPVEFEAPNGTRLANHTRIEGDLELASGHEVTGDLVVTGQVRLGPGARIVGSLKGHADIRLGEGAAIDGAVIARGGVATGLRARLGGPVVAEERIDVGPGTTVGSPTRETSLAAPRIVLHPGSVVHGLVTATDSGESALPSTS